MAAIRDIKSGRSGDPPRAPAPRRLAAIVAGDISGYSRLMEIDEEGTHGRVKRIERDLIEPSIAEHHGRLVKTTGDGFIAIFDSPVESVRCSIVIQQNLLGRNASLPKNYWIEYRIASRRHCRSRPGLHLGRHLRADQTQAGVRLRVARGSQGQEHHRSGAG